MAEVVRVAARWEAAAIWIGTRERQIVSPAFASLNAAGELAAA